MRRAVHLAFASVAAALASCHAAPKHVFSVHEVIENIDFLNGRTVRVGGYLPTCGRYDCALYPSQEDVRRRGIWFAAVVKEGKKPPFEEPESLGIGSDGDIDKKAAPLVGHYVLITGTVDNRCRFHRCLDRGADIHPMAIEARRPSSIPADRTPDKKA
jgi:hypothetical protein